MFIRMGTKGGGRCLKEKLIERGFFSKEEFSRTSGKSWIERWEKGNQYTEMASSRFPYYQESQ